MTVSALHLSITQHKCSRCGNTWTHSYTLAHSASGAFGGATPLTEDDFKLPYRTVELSPEQLEPGCCNCIPRDFNYALQYGWNSKTTLGLPDPSQPKPVPGSDAHIALIKAEEAAGRQREAIARANVIETPTDINKLI